jgi:CRISPR-associated protein Cas1
MGARPVFTPGSDNRRVRRGDPLPDYLPARMVNEFVYCPRLFFYEWVDGLFRESADTIEGSVQHNRVDARVSRLPAPEEGVERDDVNAEAPEKIHARSVTLSSERLRVIAKLDLVDAEGNTATPVDYKHGAPRKGKEGLDLWPSDRIQLALQAIILRENGYECEEAVVFYQRTRQRVRVPVTAEFIAQAEEAVARAWQLAETGVIPPPLVDSPKCVACSLNAICLPDETNQLISILDSANGMQMDLFHASDTPRKPPVSEGLSGEIRPMMTARDDLKPLYLNT